MCITPDEPSVSSDGLNLWLCGAIRMCNLLNHTIYNCSTMSVAVDVCLSQWFDHKQIVSSNCSMNKQVHSITCTIPLKLDSHT